MWHRVRAWFRRDAIADEIREELEFHVAMRAEELERQGQSPDAARRAARRRVGNISRLRDEGYDVRGAGVLESFTQDLRHSARLWRLRPASSAAVVGTMAAGTALVAVLVAVLHAAWLRPLPLTAADRLVRVDLSFAPPDSEVAVMSPSYRDVERLRQHIDVFAALGARTTLEDRLVLDHGEPERITGYAATPGYFEALGAVPVVGRTFTESDLRTGAPAVVVLGHAFWRQRFGADRSIVGTSTRLDGRDVTIVGVAPAAFHRTVHVWRPLVMSGPEADFPGSGLDVQALLSVNTTPALAQQRLADHVGHWPPNPFVGRIVGASLHLVYDDVVSTTAQAVWLMIGSVAVLVVLVVVNVAGLVYVQGARRWEELAVRAALGAGRGRLIRQQFTEATALGLVAALIGLVVAVVLLDGLVAVLPIEMSPHVEPSINLNVVLITSLASLLTAWAVALAPAWRLSRADLRLWMAGRPSERQRRWLPRPGQWVTAVQVALAALLLVGGALLAATVDRLLAVDLGFEPERFHVLEVAPLDPDPAVWSTYFTALLTRLEAHPSIEAVAATDWLPLSNRAGVVLAADPSVDWNLWFIGASSQYAKAMGLRMREGRWFTEAEMAAPVVVLTASAARAVFRAEPALGRSVNMGGPPTHPRLHTVVGIVDDIKGWGPKSKPETTAFVPIAPGPAQPPAIVIRTKSEMSLSVTELKGLATGLGPRVVFERLRGGTALLDDAIAAPRHRLTLVAVLAMTGLCLALIGIAGVSMESVVRRTKEIGVRTACGASGGQVVFVVVRDALQPAVLGLILGLGIAAYAGRLLEPFLFATSPTDGRLYLVVALAALVVVSLAAWIPARRAASIDAAAVLKHEK